MAWFRPMGVDSVVYHLETVLGRGDDHPGRALDYYASRGETPLRWGATEAAAQLALSGEVTPEMYAAAFGPGGFRHPLTGECLVKTTRPGFEIVVSAHKSTAVLGVIGRAEHMHSILDAQTDGTMEWLDTAFRARGGRRGRAAAASPTTGLMYAVTRHGTTRAGDPGPHDHVLVANICEMRDTGGGYKGLFSALLRDTVEAATMVGRLHSAALAVELGYAIEPDHGPSGRLREWRIKGIPIEVCELFSKRTDEIANYLGEHGYRGYRAQRLAARITRAAKRGVGIDELLSRWVAELESAGWTVERLLIALDSARRDCTGLAPALSHAEIDTLAAQLLDPEGDFLARAKVFTRTRLIAEVAPLLYGHDPAELDHVIDRIIASPLVVPLIGNTGAREQAYAAAAVLATEQTIADRIGVLATSPGPRVPRQLIARAIAATGAQLDVSLSQGQRATAAAVCSSGGAVEIVVGVAGAGKTTALGSASDALQAAGYTVIGTATSSQAARTLGDEAAIPAHTIRSLVWRLQHGRLKLDRQTVTILDEAAMTADADLARLLLAVEQVGGKVVLVGDPRQLSAVGPGGAMAAVLARHPEVVTELTENKRQHNPAERAALSHLRDGDLDSAIGFYVGHARVRVQPNRVEALAAMVDAWGADTCGGHDTSMVAWRRRNVADLNRLARAKAQQLGRLSGDELQASGGKPYAAGDLVVLLAPNHEGELVTSQRGVVMAVDHQARSLTVATDDGRAVTLAGKGIDADHLDHGYAMTVHRQQGATWDRTHYFADGGGRELAYVALSRARECSTIHAAADDLDQAIEDIRHDWSLSQAQCWITPTARVGYDERTHPTESRVETPEAIRKRLVSELERLERAAPPDVTAELFAGRLDVRRLGQDLRDLIAGNGRWETSRRGRVARDLVETRRKLELTEGEFVVAANPLERRRARRTLERHRNAEAVARAEWDQVCAPIARRLQTKLDVMRRHVAQLESDHRFNMRWWAEHPGLARRIYGIRDQLSALDTTAAATAVDAERRPDIDNLARADRMPSGEDAATKALPTLDRLQRRTVEAPDVAGGIGL